MPRSGFFIFPAQKFARARNSLCGATTFWQLVSCATDDVKRFSYAKNEFFLQFLFQFRNLFVISCYECLLSLPLGEVVR